uniref:Uncharacterized protein n=1 Tax=Trichogramma kaykai TaxID=54128 RepID=A0ABD2W719_9HYME
MSIKDQAARASDRFDERTNSHDERGREEREREGQDIGMPRSSGRATCGEITLTYTASSGPTPGNISGKCHICRISLNHCRRLLVFAKSYMRAARSLSH